MTTTLGDLIADLHQLCEQAFGDAELAAIATEVTIDDVLHRKGIRPRPSIRSIPRRPAPSRPGHLPMAARLPRAA